ncbi:MAG TPA: PRC-barrel domain-containing protein [Caulobacteraceae bacterium]|nr:PRC-barrel domain-containing protein [Caulobacteraceae bacterium]
MSDPMKQSTDSSLIAASKVEGKPVYDPEGERLGTVKEIYIDKLSGEVEFAALAFGGVLGVGAKYHPLPWTALDYDTQRDGFVVDIDKDALEASPAYEQDRLTEANYGWGAEVRNYYSTLGASGPV